MEKRISADMYYHQKFSGDIKLPNVRALENKSATLLLGTDRHIGEEYQQIETRVGITPHQLDSLREWLEDSGIKPRLYVVKGAGNRAGFSDSDYESAGGLIIEEERLTQLDPAPDVVHALKEPSMYEKNIPGCFIRIGALHTGVFQIGGALSEILKRRNFCAIMDGSAIGGFSYRFTGAYPVPLRCSMSVFASEIAADYLLERIPSDSKIVISGGGVVGVSAVNRILRNKEKSGVQILVIEAREERCEKVRAAFEDHHRVTVKRGTTVEREDLSGVDGLIFGAFSPGSGAPKVVDVEALEAMNQNSVVVDVAIDEGGSIRVSDGVKIEDAIDALKKNIRYFADTHMPRKYPAEASRAHGNAVLPYLAVLLYLSAQEGGSSQAIKKIYQHDLSKEPDTYFDAILSDLKNGLAFMGPDPISIGDAIVKDRKRIEQYLTDSKIPWKTHSIS